MNTQKEACTVAVIDLYSVKPLDRRNDFDLLHTKLANKIITVEDHYKEGGLGEAVACAVTQSEHTYYFLAVTKLPRSGKPEELLAYEDIDAHAIITTVRTMIK